MIKLNYLSYALIVLAIISGGSFATNLNQWISETQTYGTVLTPKMSEITEIALPEDYRYQVFSNYFDTHQFFEENYYYALIFSENETKFYENDIVDNFSIVKVGFSDEFTAITSVEVFNTTLNENQRINGFGKYKNNFIAIQNKNYLLYFNPEYGITRNVTLPTPQWQDYNTTYPEGNDSIWDYKYLSSFCVKGDSLWIQRSIQFNTDHGSESCITLLEYDANTVTLISKLEMSDKNQFAEIEYQFLGHYNMFNGYQSLWFEDPEGDPYHEYNSGRKGPSYVEYSLEEKKFGRILLIDEHLPNNLLSYEDVYWDWYYPVYMFENQMLQSYQASTWSEAIARLIGFRITPFSEKQLPLFDLMLTGGSSLAFIGTIIINLYILNKKEVIPKKEDENIDVV